MNLFLTNTIFMKCIFKTPSHTCYGPAHLSSFRTLICCKMPPLKLSGTLRVALWLDIEVAWPKSLAGGQPRLGGPLWSTRETFSCLCSFQRCVGWTYSSTVVTCGAVWSHCVLFLWSGVVWICVIFLIGFVSLELQHLKINRHKSNIKENRKYYHYKKYYRREWREWLQAGPKVPPVGF